MKNRVKKARAHKTGFFTDQESRDMAKTFHDLIAYAPKEEAPELIIRALELSRGIKNKTSEDREATRHYEADVGAMFKKTKPTSPSVKNVPRPKLNLHSRAFGIFDSTSSSSESEEYKTPPSSLHNY